MCVAVQQGRQRGAGLGYGLLGARLFLDEVLYRATWRARGVTAVALTYPLDLARAQPLEAGDVAQARFGGGERMAAVAHTHAMVICENIERLSGVKEGPLQAAHIGIPIAEAAKGGEHM